MVRDMFLLRTGLPNKRNFLPSYAKSYVLEEAALVRLEEELQKFEDWRVRVQEEAQAALRLTPMDCDEATEDPEKTFANLFSDINFQ